jgi:hypothetical protein
MEPSNKDTIKTTNCSSLQPCIDTSKLNPIFVAPTRAVTRAHKSHDKLFRIKSRRLYHPANPKLLFSKNSTNPSLRICCRSYFSQQVILDDYKENNYADQKQLLPHTRMVDYTIVYTILYPENTPVLIENIK